MLKKDKIEKNTCSSGSVHLYYFRHVLKNAPIVLACQMSAQCLATGSEWKRMGAGWATKLTPHLFQLFADWFSGQCSSSKLNNEQHA